MLIGVLSDTHGLLRPEVLATLSAPGRKLDHILHAGDIGDLAIPGGPGIAEASGILARLRQIAPVTAIRGNIDTSVPCASLPATEAVELGGCLLYMVHALTDLDLHPHAAGIAAIIYGHSHRSSIEHRDGVLYLNPGSAGPRRFRLPVTLALLHIDSGVPSAEILTLPV